MLVKLDPSVIDTLCCPLCKDDLHVLRDSFRCQACGLTYPAKTVRTGRDRSEKVFDFRIHRPEYCVPASRKIWQKAQTSYEEFHGSTIAVDSLQKYRDEIDSVKEIYTEEFHLAGRVLDVGGHQGRLRHYLAEDVTLYVAIDPYIGILEKIDEQPNLVRAYPCLSEPYNFLAANSEYLPFKPKTFDWIHMRSVIDHFEDPFRAFVEAFRCCRTGGTLLIGLAIMERLHERQKLLAKQEKLSPLRKVETKFRKDGLSGVAAAVMRTIGAKKSLEPDDGLQGDHIFRLTHSELLDLLERTGWRITKEHWQKAPYDHCIYASATAKELSKVTA
jgi:ubiquinone/menaquinone biosynthesis C-methylase UbiE